MSVVYSYCVLPVGHHPPATLIGLGNGPVTGHDVGHFTVWTSSEVSPPALDIAGIARHHDVVTAATTATPLPLRFGTWTLDHATLEARIGGMGDALDAALAATTGKVEMGLRMEGLQETASQDRALPTDGRGYLQALSRSQAQRRRRRELQDALVATITDGLGTLGTDVRVTYLDAPGLLSLAHLIARGEELAYRRRIEALAQTVGGVGRVHVTGPWPPYSFVTI